MFTVTIDLFEFENMVGFWSGAKTNWDNFTDEEKNFLNDYVKGMEFNSLTQINDFIWFDAPNILTEVSED